MDFFLLSVDLGSLKFMTFPRGFSPHQSSTLSSVIVTVLIVSSLCSRVVTGSRYMKMNLSKSHTVLAVPPLSSSL